MFNKYICPICGDDSLEECTIEGYTGMCDACSCNKMSDELEAKWAKELDIYFKRTGDKVDIDDFYHWCMNGDVSIKDLRNLPELKSFYHQATDYLKAVNYKPSPQLEIDFDKNDLPF